MKQQGRRDFIKRSAGIAGGFTLATSSTAELFAAEKAPLYKISLAQWSLYKLFPKSAINVHSSRRAETSPCT